MIARFILRDGQAHQGFQIGIQSLANVVAMTTQSIALARQTLRFQMGIQIIKAVITRRRHHEVTPNVSDHPFHFALIIAPSWPPELVVKKIMGLQLCEPPRANTCFIPEYPRNGDLRIVINDGLRNAAKERKGSHMAITKCFGRFRRISLHKHRI